MIPVLLFDGDGYHGLRLEEFERNLLAICDAHQRENRACIFAIILHGPESPQFSKALSDKDYWIALNSISGRALSVFAVFDGVLREDSQGAFLMHGKRLDEMVQVQQRVLETTFGLAKIRMPALLLFQVSDGVVSGSTLVELKAATTEAAYREMAEILECVAMALKDSRGALVRIPEAAFSRMERAVRTREVSRAAKAVGAGIKNLTEILGLFAIGK